MHARTREMLDYGQLCGFEHTGLDGRGHHVLTHPNGATVRVASTPGDYRGDDNVKALMRRLSGVTPDTGRRAGHYRKGTGRGGFSMRAALNERSHGPGMYSIGAPDTGVREPLGLTRLRTEQARLITAFTDAPSNALAVLRNISRRIELEIYD